MRRRNHRSKAAETLKKTDSRFEFKLTDPSSSRKHSDLKRRKRVTFDSDDVDHRSPLNESLESQVGRSLDAKTSEFAFFKKLKSNFGLCSEFSNSKSSNNVKQNPKTFKSRVQSEVKDDETKDGCKGYSFSTPIHTTRGGSCGLSMSHVNLTQKDKEKGAGKSSPALSRDKDTVGSGNNLRSGGISDEKQDIFSVKRKKLNQLVKDVWFPEIHELNSNGHDLVSVLLTRLFPGTKESHPSRFSKEREDRVKRRTFSDSPRLNFLKRSHESYTEADHTLKMEKDRLISWQGWLENSIAPSLQFPSGHVHSNLIPNEPEENSFAISYPKGSLYRPPLLEQRVSLLLPVEETLDCSPIASFHSRNYKPFSLGYHRKESRYSSKHLSDEHREPASALLLEWNTETASTRKTDDLPLTYHTELTTYPIVSSPSMTDNQWSSDYSSSYDLITREVYPLPLISHHASDSHFEHELERHLIDDEDVIAPNLNLQTFHHTTSSDCLTRDYTYHHNLSNSPMDHYPFKVPECETISFRFSSVSNSNLLEASGPHYKTNDWIPFQLQSPQIWNDS